MSTSAEELAVSVVIPTHNPRMDYLQRVLEALRVQTLPREKWELLLIDNASRDKVEGRVDIGRHGNARVVREGKLGLTFARLSGFAEAKGELIVMVDDDNALAPDYLETAVRLAQEHPILGAFGGKCLPDFEVEPEPWLEARGKGLGLRDRGEREEFFPEAAIAQSGQMAVGSWQGEENRRLTTEDRKLRLTEFPDCAPIGAGMVIRREAAAAYAERIAQRACGMRRKADGRMSDVGDRRTEDERSPNYRTTEPRLGETALRQPPSHRAASVITDRRGDSLASGGDNDICLTVIEEGWQVGYLPQLQLTHLIPKGRMTLDYHRRMERDSMKSYVLMLDQHGIRPWPAMAKWTLLLRVANDFLRVKPWRGPEESLRFWGHVGMYEGRAALPGLAAAAAVGSGQ